MPERLIVDSHTAITYAWLIVLAFWGGIAGYLQKIKTGVAKRFSISELIGELVISGFVGAVTIYLCEYASFPIALTGASVGIAGHMGSRFILLIEKRIMDKIEKSL